MRNLSLAINGRTIQAATEPRMHLADFLRGQQFLTGTHIGCEHGVCGACTVLIDGAPARSCITYAVACDGAAVTTIEGLENDPVIVQLREAFSAEHALQCGFCTPAMLIAARDIVTRLPDADEKRIRLELAGNLCRCTGYVGIVAAIRSVLTSRANGARQEPPLRRGLGPVGAHAPAANAVSGAAPRRAHVRQVPSASLARDARNSAQWSAVEADGTELAQSFPVAFPRDEVWRILADLDQVARCMPGARLTKPPQDGAAEGEVTIKLGPIVAAFAGVVDVTRDDQDYRGTVRAAGRDARSASNARAIISYTVEADGQAASRVAISTKFLLTGALAQFSRSGLIKNVADHLTQLFARNLEARLSGTMTANDDRASDGSALNVGALARKALWTRLTTTVRRMLGRA